MSYKNILIPLGLDSKDLKALHHALSLAERIQSRLFVLSLENATTEQGKKNPVIEACLDVIHSACEQGLQISFHIASDSAEEKLLKLLEREHIDLIILSDTEIQVEKMIRGIMTMISCQVIQVKEKNDINFIQ
ncbi:MAG: universal stress protein [Deltaproteobacteria bacterium]|nr:universal stress protein [Deltaproteobacteria bacterium]MBW1846706.1 universal stress protein [Deltaproteobacteria bacterium]MBW2363696.1 universal stress protein [Deltaproteobacteria bacterium]